MRRSIKSITKMILAVAGFVLCASPATANAGSATDYKVSELAAAKKYSQLIIVSGYNKNHAKVSMYTKKGAQWECDFTTKGRVGKKGIGKTREGRRMTPRGDYCLHTAFGIKKNPGCTRRYIKVNRKHYWSAKTNRLQRKYARGEHLIACGRAYNYAIAIGYNMKAKKGAGSAFFLHCFGKRGINAATAGCVSIPQKYMKKCLRSLRGDTRIIIDYEKNIKNY